MLSSQTKDEIVSETILSLVADNGLSPASIAKLSEKRLNELIGKIGFHNRKASHIKQATDRILSEHHGDIPCDRDFILSLPGVGPKMANLFMQCAYGVCEGVSVDVHMHRIFPLWGWVPKGLPTAEHTRQHLEAWLPREHWQEINGLVVGFGQTMCPALKPRCPECPLQDVCPSARGVGKRVKRERSTSPVRTSPTKKQPILTQDDRVTLSPILTRGRDVKREEKGGANVPRSAKKKKKKGTAVKIQMERDIEDW